MAVEVRNNQSGCPLRYEIGPENFKHFTEYANFSYDCKNEKIKYAFLNQWNLLSQNITYLDTEIVHEFIKKIQNNSLRL